jgi:hypothetical protein
MIDYKFPFIYILFMINFDNFYKHNIYITPNEFKRLHQRNN